jgi:hypothetical protein
MSKPRITLGLVETDPTTTDDDRIELLDNQTPSGQSQKTGTRWIRSNE